ncbi:protein bric-a-brac 2-like [Homarus americanus]|uniref:protein bric-a-brac 2-like n=1 Tax=Homarus americanus TaxID=6706 RepID=UPI001C468936|nr:protein bric-a-brac 2-like [Homarus americanus]
MASQQFCLRWNNYQSNLMQVFDQLLQTESFVDVTLSCEGQSIKAHRMVLSACSPYFQCLLSEAPCTHPVIILQGVKWPELKAVVEFMYKGEINICQEQLGSLLRVAESLKIRGLAEVDGDGAEPAVLTSPSVSPAARALSNTLEDSSPSSVLAAARKRRRYSGDDGSRPCTPMTPTSGPEAMETTTIDLSGPLIRSGMTATLPGSPLTSLAARLPGAMPPPAPMAPHLTHLPPLSPLLNMHSMPRPHAPDDFEIRPGIAEMIREEERQESTNNHHTKKVTAIWPSIVEPRPAVDAEAAVSGGGESSQPGANDAFSAAASVTASTVNPGASAVNVVASAVNAGASTVNDGATAVNAGASTVNDGASAVNVVASAVNAMASAVNVVASAVNGFYC